jgi:hypothetical protein
MEFIKKTIKLGNSAGVLLPKKLLNAEVKITVINKPFDIKKEALKLVSPYIEDLLGIYILNNKPAEILAVSTTIKKAVKSPIKLVIMPLEIIKKDIKQNLNLRKKILEAKVITNPKLLDELKRGYN